MPAPANDIGETTIGCPDCGRKLVIRTNRETGQDFLGCPRYPDCQHTQPLPEWVRLKRAGAAMLPGLEG